MKSFRQMTNEGTIKRADAEKIQFKDIHVEPGFNVPGRTDTDDEDDQSLYEHIASGGVYPQLEVRPRDGGGVYVVDGHRRHKQIGRAIDAGRLRPDKDGLYWVRVRQFEGNDVKRVARLATSQEGKALTPIGLCHVYSTLRGMGLGLDDIAAEVKRKPVHVKRILLLADSNHDVHQMVASGQVSATIAIKEVQRNGEKAGPALKVAHDKAKAMGKKKITAATLSSKPKIEQNDALDAARWRWISKVADFHDLVNLQNNCTSQSCSFSDALADFVDMRMSKP